MGSLTVDFDPRLIKALEMVEAGSIRYDLNGGIITLAGSGQSHKHWTATAYYDLKFIAPEDDDKPGCLMVLTDAGRAALSRHRGDAP